MSLIMDALKKAQQLRLKGQNVSSSTEPHSKIEHRQKVKKYSLIFIIIFSTLLVSFFLGYKVLPPLTSYKKERVVLVEKKEPSVALNTKNEIMAPHKKEVLPIQREEKPLPSMSPFPEGKKEEPVLKQRDDQKMVKVKVPEKTAIEKELTAPLPDSQKEAPSPPKKNELENTLLTYFNLGVDFYRQREISKAIQAYQKVIELDPTYVEAYNNLGIIYQDIGDFDKAIEAYQKAIEVNPQYEKAYNNLGILLFVNERYDESIRAFQNALAINPHSIESNINLGTLFKRKGQFEKAIEYYQKALSINPLLGETHYNIGLLYEQLENFNLAISHYQKFIQLSSKTYPDLVSKVQRQIEYLMTIHGEKTK
jgi:type IV pilus biogenesis/stability protein PilW